MEFLQSIAEATGTTPAALESRPMALPFWLAGYVGAYQGLANSRLPAVGRYLGAIPASEVAAYTNNTAGVFDFDYLLKICAALDGLLMARASEAQTPGASQ